MMQKRMFLGVLLACVPVLGLCVLMGSTGFGLPNWQDPTGQTILQLRLYRVLAGLVVGAALSCSGVIMQALLRNPLAEPYVLGVSSGAGLAAALAILAGVHLGGFGLPVMAFIGATLTLSLVYVLAVTGGGSLSIYSLILSGVIVSAVCSSLLMFGVTLAPVDGMHTVIWWMLGSLQAPSTALLAVVAGLVVVGAVAAWALAPELNALSLGQELAHHVGVQTRLALCLGLLTATLLAASAVSLSGLIGFVGLVVPHVMRHVVGPDHRRLIPATALAGGTFLALCDACARTVLAPVEIPVGVMTALIGGPFFLIILFKRRRQGWIE